MFGYFLNQYCMGSWKIKDLFRNVKSKLMQMSIIKRVYNKCLSK